MFARNIGVGGKQFDQVISQSLKCDMGEARRMRLGLPGEFLMSSGEGAMLSIAAEAATRATAVRAGAAAAVIEDRRSMKPPTVLRHGIHPAAAPREVSNADITELLDTITDEVSMCLRYHQSLFRGRPINRAIFVGGESRQAWLCQHIVKATARIGAHGRSDGPHRSHRRVRNPRPHAWQAATRLGCGVRPLRRTNGLVKRRNEQVPDCPLTSDPPRPPPVIAARRL